ncbi:arsenate reductase [Pectinatus brassicae]|uniref:Arsenate reductase n=1 Tax=Pectinatus brassicae TaxID=862415 RepID=A0A840UJ86_9FIRM|nr:arsenate reductase ArsC [Pectinatus brassicae]MBB5337049.1 arsenate reductase [Pectinatus brassicae]
MVKVAFVCVHNSCRSQIAEAFMRVMGLNICESYSAGTETKDSINQDAVRLMKEVGIDMEILQKSKLLSTLPSIDVVITMGCNVQCPYLPCKYREDWGLDDPSGKSDEEFTKIINSIHNKVEQLIARISKNELY